MKKLYYLIIYPMYWLGCLCAYGMYKIHWLYELYSWFMAKSGDIQEWAGLDKPWTILSKK